MRDSSSHELMHGSWTWLHGLHGVLSLIVLMLAVYGAYCLARAITRWSLQRGETTQRGSDLTGGHPSNR